MRRVLARGLVILVALLVLLVLVAAYVLRASLPTLDGARRAPGVGAEVAIERDALGVATLRASSREDLAFGLGFAHAQDRWFQMDLLRRAAAGELAALLGPALVETDRELRRHGFRTVARAILAAAEPADRHLVEAYAAGANAGLAALGARPFEYLVLRAAPEPWRAEDTLLVVHAMFLDLQDPGGRSELQRALLAAALPEPVVRFLGSEAGEWAAALDGSRPEPPVLPGPAEYDLRTLGELDFSAPPRARRARPPGVGSNNWAVAGARTAGGAAIVANDMHLGLRLPNTWYRARLELVRNGAREFAVTGATLPGTPAVIVGSNGHVAWGFTNSYGDYADVVVLEPDPADAARYLSPDGSRPIERVAERIEVRGGPAVALEVERSRWGPVLGRLPDGRRYAVQWTAHDPAAVNLGVVGLERARNVDEALALALDAGIPAQNLVVGDAAGRIAWTVIGRIPLREAEGARPRLSTDPLAGFRGWAGAERSQVRDPADGQLWTANARVVGGAGLALLGDGGYDRGARAGQIAAALRAAGDRQTPAHSLAVQLDDRALFLERWRARLDALLDARALEERPARAALREALERWSGHAAIDDPGYRVVRAFRDEVENRVFHALIAPARAAHPERRFYIPASFEGPLWALLEAAPPHLLPPAYVDWRAFLLAAADAAQDGLAESCDALPSCTWGEYNRVRVRHPLSAAVPALARWLDVPVEPLPGDRDLPRVQGRGFGASQRFAVAPGREEEGYFHMPGGQSGHPLSRFYRAGHEAWARGEPTPFLPGEPAHRLLLQP